jgi:MarR family transcriptional regulator, organic hydroperoxide resistance regulator
MKVPEFKNIVWDYTRKIDENMNITLNSMGNKYGLTTMQLRILMELFQKGSKTIGSLAEDICIAGANISTMCKKLEKLGFVERNRAKEDERIVRIKLTEIGRQTILEIDNYFNEKISQNMADEAEETFETIISGMGKLYSLLQKISRNDKKNKQENEV